MMKTNRKEIKIDEKSVLKKELKELWTSKKKKEKKES